MVLVSAGRSDDDELEKRERNLVKTRLSYRLLSSERPNGVSVCVWLNCVKIVHSKHKYVRVCASTAHQHTRKVSHETRNFCQLDFDYMYLLDDYMYLVDWCGCVCASVRLCWGRLNETRKKGKPEEAKDEDILRQLRCTCRLVRITSRNLSSWNILFFLYVLLERHFLSFRIFEKKYIYTKWIWVKTERTKDRTRIWSAIGE